MWDFNVRRRLGESAKKKRRVGLGWEQKRCISIYLGSAQDISEIRTGSSSRVSDVPSRDGLV